MSMETPSRLILVQTEEQRSAVVADDTQIIVINELLGDVPVAEYDDIYGQFRRNDGPSIGGVPFYDVIWQRFGVPFNGFPDDPTSLCYQIVLHRELEAIDGIESVSRIECRGLESCYQACVADFARNHGIETNVTVRSRRHHALGLLRGLFSLFVVILDGLVSLVLRYRYDVDRSAPVVFVPHLNRFDAMRPVIEAADYEHCIVAPVSTIEWLYYRFRGQWKGPAEFSPVPIGVYVTPRTILREVSLFGRLFVEELLLKRIATDLRDLVVSEFDVRLDHAVERALGNTYPTTVGPMANLWLAERLYQVTEAERVVVGSMSLRQQLFLVAADRGEVGSFHVPHTVPTHHDTVPKVKTTHIVPSDSALAFHKEADYLWQDDHPVVALGRPLLEEIATNRPATEPTTEPIRVLIATQPLDEPICHEFVSQIIESFEIADAEYSAVIKIHPTEDSAFYAEYEKEYPRVTVAEADLNRHIREADLTFIIRTNVGIESIAQGTPVVSVNQYEPFINTVPYISEGPIPVCRSRGELEEFVTELTTERIDELRAEQVDFFDQNYFIDTDIAAEIASFVKNPDRGNAG